MNRTKWDGIATSSKEFQGAKLKWRNRAFIAKVRGRADDATPPTECVQRGTVMQAAGALIAWRVYPGATHAFDEPGEDRFSKTLGHAKYDPNATADAHIQVQRFLRTHLQ